MLSDAQIAVLRADILADPAFAPVPNSNDGAYAIAQLYNATAIPDYWVWRGSVSKGELVQTTSEDGTTFNWTGAGFIGRSIGEQTAWRELFDASGNCNPSLANVRQAFMDIFSGSVPPAPANRVHLATVARRRARRIEKLFALGAGTTSAPSTMGFEGQIDYTDVYKARN